MEKISRFFQRIGMDPHTPIEHTVDFLGRVQSGCVMHIAYENLDILAGKALSLDPKAIYDKVVLRGRGGYCFELNGLLTHMLRDMGFHASDRFARFLRGESALPMRRHRVTVVQLADARYLCDIGVGQIAPRLPLRMEEDLLQHQYGETYRFAKDDTHGWVLWELHQGQWRQLLCFQDEAVPEVDFIQPTFYCEKHPDSVFNKDFMIAIKTPTGRRAINGRDYKIFEGETIVHLEEGITDDRLQALLTNEFKLTL